MKSKTSCPLKTASESFDALRTNGSEIELIEKNPFMLSLSKHVPLFSAACWG
jgi:hypothetical protein